MNVYNEDEMITPEWLNETYLEEVLRKYENDQSVQLSDQFGGLFITNIEAERMSVYNEDEMITPEWLNEAFLEEVLRKYENDQSVQMVNWEISPGSMKGDHFASVMFRAKVEYSSLRTPSVQRRSMIIKTMPWVDGMKLGMLSESKLFETEIAMYSKTLPKIEQILAENGDSTRLAPRLMYCSLEPHKVIVMEDLCELGYSIVRNRFLTEEEVKAVYNKLAKLHAVSYMLGQSGEHEEVTKYGDGLFSSSLFRKNSLVMDGIKKFMEMLSSHEELHEYLPIFKTMEKELFQECQGLFRAYFNGKKDEIFVLNHGDFHPGNLMFKFDEQKQVEDILMVDYQISVFAPSILDVIYSNFMLLSPHLRLKRHELMYYYFEQFRRTLRIIGFSGEMPKFADFQIAAIKYRHFSIFLLSTFLPIILFTCSGKMEDLKDIDAEQIFNGNMIYRNPTFVEEVRRLMPVLLHEGFLD